MTASPVVDRRSGYAAILLTEPGKPNRFVSEVVIRDGDIPGMEAEELAEKFIEWVEGADVVNCWGSGWRHGLLYEGFLQKNKAA